jgi:hypothetical protein
VSAVLPPGIDRRFCYHYLARTYNNFNTTLSGCLSASGARPNSYHEGGGATDPSQASQMTCLVKLSDDTPNESFRLNFQRSQDIQYREGDKQLGSRQPNDRLLAKI